jgi:HNH endonuclease
MPPKAPRVERPTAAQRRYTATVGEGLAFSGGSPPGEWLEYTGLYFHGREDWRCRRRKPLRYRYLYADTIEIALTKGETALIDAADFDRVKGYTWAVNPVYGNTGLKYAQSTTGHSLGFPVVFLHRIVLGLTPDDPIEVDHFDSDGLNCRRVNLRLATRQQNAAWARRVRGESRYRGVVRNNPSGWHARIKVNRAVKHLGTYATPEEAALSYNLAAQEVFGEFAILNVIPDQPSVLPRLNPWKRAPRQFTRAQLDQQAARARRYRAARKAAA